jgi:DNA-directed RNA polymerase II subunit RPB3
MEVTTDHIKPVSKDCSVFPVKFPEQDPIIIAKLRKNQELDMHMIAKKGIGKEHSKWSPVCSVVMQHEPEIEFIGNGVSKLNQNQKKEFVNSCPTKVYKYDETRKTVDIENPLNCTYCEECLLKLETFGLDPHKHVRIQPKKNRFLFKIESIGSLRAIQIVDNAFKELKNKLSEVLSKVEIEPRSIISNR